MDVIKRSQSNGIKGVIIFYTESAPAPPLIIQTKKKNVCNKSMTVLNNFDQDFCNLTDINRRSLENGKKISKSHIIEDVIRS